MHEVRKTNKKNTLQWKNVTNNRFDELQLKNQTIDPRSIIQINNLNRLLCSYSNNYTTARKWSSSKEEATLVLYTNQQNEKMNKKK